MKSLRPYFNSGIFTEEESNQILKTGNKMLEQRMVASPYFQNYLRALTTVKQSSSDPERHFQRVAQCTRSDIG